QASAGVARTLHAQGQLAAASAGVARRDDFQNAGKLLLYQMLEIAGKCNRLLAQSVDSRAVEDFQRYAQRRQRQDRRVRQLPAVSAPRRGGPPPPPSKRPPG